MKGCDISECTLQLWDLARDEEGARRNRKGGLGAVLTAQPRPPGLMTRLKGYAFIHCASHWSPRRAHSRGERMQDVGLKCCAFFTCAPWALPKVNSRVLHLFSDSVRKFMFLTEFYKRNICVEFAHCSQFSQMMFTRCVLHTLLAFNMRGRPELTLQCTFLLWEPSLAGSEGRPLAIPDCSCPAPVPSSFRT